VKLTDRARGVIENLAVASRSVFTQVSSREYWRTTAVRTAGYWRSEWAQASPVRVYLATAVAATFLVASSLTAIRQMDLTGSWNRVYTNGTYVGMVPNDPQVLSEMNKIATGYSVDVHFSPVHTAVNGQYDWQTVASLPTQAAAVLVNGKTVVYTSNQAAAQKILAELKKTLVPAHLGTAASVSFVGDVTVAPVVVGVAEVLNPTAAFRYLLRPTVDQVTGRSGMILGLPVALSINPSKSSVTHTSSGPLLSVQAVQTVTRKTSLAYSTHYVSTNQLGIGEIKVIHAGSPGVAQEQVKQEFVNGHLASQKVLSEKILKQPQTEIAERGTNAGIAYGGWVWPTTTYLVTSPFGWRVMGGYSNFHPGIDLGCPIGTPIFATNNGVVEDAGWNNGGYGNWVKINNGNGLETVFGHMSNVIVHAGQMVAKGQLLGYSGDTGWATGPHLHYEVRQWGTAINPGPYM